MATIEIRPVDATNMELRLNGDPITRFPLTRGGDDYRLSGEYSDSSSADWWDEPCYSCEAKLEIRDGIVSAIDELAKKHPAIEPDLDPIKKLLAQ